MASTVSGLLSAASMPIEIVVPVYNAAADLRACVDSVLVHTTGAYRLVLIDDASPDPAIGRYFDELFARKLPHLELVRNPRNLGFTGTANVAMTRSRADVVLLNSDTVVTSGWLDALARCAASDPRIGTITPFSNNAEIASYPCFCENNAWPEGADPEPVRRSIEAAAVPLYPELPTGVGFCLFVRRALIDAIGTFDPVFGAGYGEENDFCLRAHEAGFRNVLCDDAFVLHRGGRSFEGAKETLGVANLRRLVDRHPHYPALVRDYIERDPLKPLRQAALTAYERMSGPSLGVLHIVHGGGGTEAHARSLVEATRGRIRHAFANVSGETWRVEEHRADGSTMLCEFARRDDEPLEDFVRMLCAAFGSRIVHLHSIAGARDRLLDAMPRLGIPYGYTVHDLNFACPTITLHRADGFFCGGVTDVRECASCLASQGGFDSVDIVRWRERHGRLLEGAAFVIAPSRWAADMLRRYFPAIEATLIPHALPPPPPRKGRARQVVMMPDEDVPTVAILGAIGPDKGARRIERLASLAAERGVNLRLVVIGYLDRTQDAWQSDDGRLTVHGRYHPGDLPVLLDYYRVSLVLFPSAGPETFAFTLSEAWLAGRPVLVPPIGALPERVGEHGGGFVMDDAEWHDEGAMLDRILDLLSPAQAALTGSAAVQAHHIALPVASEMADSTARLYARAVTGSTQEHAPVDRLRVAEAFGYRAWSPPPRPSTLGDPVAASEGSLARVARRVRRSRFGAWLVRLMPPRAVAKLRARLF